MTLCELRARLILFLKSLTCGRGAVWCGIPCTSRSTALSMPHRPAYAAARLHPACGHSQNSRPSSLPTAPHGYSLSCGRVCMISLFLSEGAAAGSSSESCSVETVVIDASPPASPHFPRRAPPPCPPSPSHHPQCTRPRRPASGGLSSLRR